MRMESPLNQRLRRSPPDVVYTPIDVTSLKDTDTAGVTRKSTEITKQVVTERLATSFRNELERLGSGYLKVQVQPVGGSRGALYHQLILQDATSVSLARVASEGEARALSIAAFFAELSTASDESAILFDDPVSSLDHRWRDNVARRLAEEAEDRQVVVFTHDIVFLLALERWCETHGVELKHQHLRRENVGAGVSSPEMPWLAMRVRDRIGALKNMWQRADKIHRTGDRQEYEAEAVRIYGLLREAWERGLEEILLGGVVERYRPSVQTKRAGQLADITGKDCSELEEGMTKCSRWLPGHDQAAAEHVSVPEPSELKTDIAALENWVSTIRKRRPG